MLETANRLLRFVTVDVFTTTRFEGNPLAVIPQADGLSDREMQRVANEFNLSETVFLSEPSMPVAAARARIFTPRRELDFAGHPTIGAAFVLTRLQSLPQSFALQENVGLVPIAREIDSGGDPLLWLTSPPNKFFETLDASLCARLLDLAPDDIASDSPPQFVSAGAPMLLIPLTSVAAVDRASVQSALVKEALGSVNAVGTLVFARKDPASDSAFDVYSRMFAPQTGIAEDPATGGAAGPLAGYMLQYGLLPRKDLSLTNEQGKRMGRRSLLRIRVTVRGENLTIQVGGSAVCVTEGQLSL